MIPRNIIKSLQEWSNDSHRKPLILRGARQIGKTTVVKEFGKEFDTFIDLNLELLADRKLFEQELSVEQLLQAILFHKKLTHEPSKKLLIFIDEIQYSPDAVAMLRYFYESLPEIYVIAAGSLLETLIDTHVSFPVGRVEYLYMYPVTFEEFLLAFNEKAAFELLMSGEIPIYAHDKLLELFHLYTMIGGMPEIVASYIQNRDWTKLAKIYQSLLIGYQDDVGKYAKNPSQATVIQHVIDKAPLNAGTRITFQNFGQSNYGSREIKEAMLILEKAMLIKLIYPTTNLLPPFAPDIKKSPRLQFVDTGLMNFFIGLQKEIFTLKDLNNLYQGRITEHIVGQQFLGTHLTDRNNLLFWVREKPQSTAEVDFVFPQGIKLIPIEIKSGKTGTLRSLHSFIDLSENNHFAIRLYNGKISREKITSIGGKSFELLNLPYYLCGILSRFIKP